MQTVMLSLLTFPSKASPDLKTGPRVLCRKMEECCLAGLSYADESPYSGLYASRRARVEFLRTPVMSARVRLRFSRMGGPSVVEIRRVCDGVCELALCQGRGAFCSLNQGGGTDRLSL